MIDPYYRDPGMTLYQGDALHTLQQMPDESVQCVATSPPYWALRDYGTHGQLGLEPTLEEYVDNMVAVFREVRRVLQTDGTCWLNLGDSYVAAPNSGHGWEHSGLTKPNGRERKIQIAQTASRRKGRKFGQLKPKDLVGIPWRVAFALQTDGWWLRSDIIWHKPNPMPESVTDRPTKAHEYIFLLSRSERYYYDADAIRQPAKKQYRLKMPDGWDTGPGAHGTFHRNGREKGQVKQDGHGRRHEGFNGRWEDLPPEERQQIGANKRSVWTVATQPYSEAHFATFPPKLIEPCILAGSREGDVVLDPFIGSGTTALVAQRHGRRCVGIDINAEYLDLAIKRNAQKTIWFTGATS